MPAPWISVHLSPEDMELGEAVGRRRDAYVRKKRKPNLHMPEEDGRLDRRILAALGELACARGLNLPWTAEKRFYGIDVGRNVEVRTTQKHVSLGLKLYPDGKDDRHYVVFVVRGSEPAALDRFVLRGWVLGREGRQRRFRKDPGGRGAPAYFVPPHELRPMWELPDDA